MADVVTGPVKLQNVCCVPGMKENLVSIAQALDNGIEEVSLRRGSVAFKQSGCVVATGMRLGNLFDSIPTPPYWQIIPTKFLQKPLKIGKADLDIWTMRPFEKLDHLGIIRATVTAPTTPCVPCLRGKTVRLRFGSRPDLIWSKSPAEIIHSDVCGKMAVHGRNGQQYFVTFVDDCSRHVSIYCMRKKSEVLKFKIFVNTIKTELSRRCVKTLISDNGGEYISHDFAEFFQDTGIQRIKSLSYTPQQNGVAERMNRTLQEMTLCMLADCDSPKQYWAEAVVYAAYIRNRSPSSSIKFYVPFKRRFGRSPTLTMTHRFGSTVYAKILDQLRVKLDYKAEPARFAGIASGGKGYLIYLNFGHLTVSREVHGFKDFGDHTSISSSERPFTAQGDYYSNSSPKRNWWPIRWYHNRWEVQHEQNAGFKRNCCWCRSCQWLWWVFEWDHTVLWRSPGAKLDAIGPSLKTTSTLCPWRSSDVPTRRILLAFSESQNTPGLIIKLCPVQTRMSWE